MVAVTLLLFLGLLVQVQARCYDPTPAFPLPKHTDYSESLLLQEEFAKIHAELERLISQPKFDINSYSIAVTSSKETLWEAFHTARDKNPERPGAIEVNGDSVYRMASVTKTFTVLAILQQHVAGNLSLDDPVNSYLSQLKGSIPWKDITLRTLASQLSGIPRDFIDNDLAYQIPDSARSSLGLPSIDQPHYIDCNDYLGKRACTGNDLLKFLESQRPIYPPKQKSTYSNLNFELLGLVLENVTGLTYSNYVESSILQPLGMAMSSFEKSNDSFAVIPNVGNYWDAEEGVARPTGGLYSSSTDMSKFVRYVLKHYNGLSPQINWFNPVSYAGTISSFYGTPWEIFRTNSILSTTPRPVTFVTKSGSVPGYSSYIILLPEYDIGIIILTTSTSPDLKESIRETISVPLVKAAEHIAQEKLAAKYAGSYSTTTTNSSIILAHSPSKTLYIESFVSNSVDLFAEWPALLNLTDPFRVQLTPTLLYRDEEKQRGEIWRGEMVPLEHRKNLIWDDFCLTDEDSLQYGEKPLFEFVFWGAEDGGQVEEVELPAFRVKLQRENKNERLDKMRLQVGQQVYENSGEKKVQHIFGGRGN